MVDGNQPRIPRSRAAGAKRQSSRATGGAGSVRRAPPRASRASQPPPPPAPPRCPPLPSELIARICDFAEPPCAAAAPYSVFERAFCSCGPASRAPLLPLLRVNKQWFGVAAPRIWAHIASPDFFVLAPELRAAPDPVFAALDSPRGAFYAASVRHLLLGLPSERGGHGVEDELVHILRRLIVHVPRFVGLNRIICGRFPPRSEALMSQLVAAARGLPLRALGLADRAATPRPGVFGPCLASWPDLDVLELPIDTDVIVPDLGESVVRNTPTGIRELAINAQFSDRELARLFGRLRKLQKLTLGLPAWMTDRALATLPGATARLTHLAIEFPEPVSPPRPFFPGIRTAVLRVLALRNVLLDALTADLLGGLLADNLNLRTLRMELCRLDTPQCDGISWSLPAHVAELHLDSCGLGPHAACFAAHLPALRVLAVMGDAFTPEGAEVVRQLKRLEELDVTGSSYDPVALVEAVVACPTLRKLRASGVAADDEWWLAELRARREDLVVEFEEVPPPPPGQGAQLGDEPPPLEDVGDGEAWIVDAAPVAFVP